MSRTPSGIYVDETNNIRDLFTPEEQRAQLKSVFDSPPVDWTEPQLKTITRLRLLSEPGTPFWDVSYCWGVLKDGTAVRVNLPFDQLSKRQTITAQILYWAKKDHVFAKGLGIFEAISKLN